LKSLDLAIPEIRGVPKFKSRSPGRGFSGVEVPFGEGVFVVGPVEASKYEKWPTAGEPVTVIMHRTTGSTTELHIAS